MIYQIGIVGDYDIFDGIATGYITQKTRTSAYTAEYTYTSESKWFDTRGNHESEPAQLCCGPVGKGEDQS